MQFNMPIFTQHLNTYLMYFTGKSSLGKSVSEALILESVNPQYNKRLFPEFPPKYMLGTNIVLNVKTKTKNQVLYRMCYQLVFFMEQSPVILWVN